MSAAQGLVPWDVLLENRRRRTIGIAFESGVATTTFLRGEPLFPSVGPTTTAYIRGIVAWLVLS